MKKHIFILVLLALAATGAFANEFSLSAGGGALFDWNFDNGYEYGSNSYAVEDVMAFGGFAFFDATYAELDVNFTYGLRQSVSNVSSVQNGANGNYMALGFSLMGKFPIDLGPVTIFPLLGGSYNMVLVDKDKDGKSVSDVANSSYTSMNLSQFGGLAGAGLDIIFSDLLFLRAEALFHFRFPNKYTSDKADTFDGGKTTFGMGPRIKVGLGFRFFSLGT